MSWEVVFASFPSPPGSGGLQRGNAFMNCLSKLDEGCIFMKKCNSLKTKYGLAAFTSIFFRLVWLHKGSQDTLNKRDNVFSDGVANNLATVIGSITIKHFRASVKGLRLHEQGQIGKSVVNNKRLNSIKEGQSSTGLTFFYAIQPSVRTQTEGTTTALLTFSQKPSDSHPSAGFATTERGHIIA